VEVVAKPVKLVNGQISISKNLNNVKHELFQIDIVVLPFVDNAKSDTLSFEEKSNKKISEGIYNLLGLKPKKIVDDLSSSFSSLSFVLAEKNDKEKPDDQSMNGPTSSKRMKLNEETTKPEITSNELLQRYIKLKHFSKKLAKESESVNLLKAEKLSKKKQ
jgi:hypothetical protein